MSDFKDKVAIVTGSSSGIGEAIAIKLASEGAKVTLCGRSEEKLKTALEKCMKANGNKVDRLTSVVGDLTKFETISNIISQTVEKFGQIDILIANAGVFFPGDTLTSLTDELYDKIMSTNLKSVVFLIKAAVDELSKSKGSIVVTSSIFATMAAGYSALTYSLTKAGIDHLTKCLSLDLGPRGIRINAVRPAYVPTHIIRGYAQTEDVDQQQKFADRMAAAGDASHPLHGRCAKPEEIADVIQYLASPKAGFVTGQVITVDAGRSFMGVSVQDKNSVKE